MPLGSTISGSGTAAAAQQAGAKGPGQTAASSTAGAQRTAGAATAAEGRAAASGGRATGGAGGNVGGGIGGGSPSGSGSPGGSQNQGGQRSSPEGGGGRGAPASGPGQAGGAPGGSQQGRGSDNMGRDDTPSSARPSLGGGTQPTSGPGGAGGVRRDASGGTRLSQTSQNVLGGIGGPQPSPALGRIAAPDEGRRRSELGGRISGLGQPQPVSGPQPVGGGISDLDIGANFPGSLGFERDPYAGAMAGLADMGIPNPGYTPGAYSPTPGVAPMARAPSKAISGQLAAEPEPDMFDMPGILGWTPDLVADRPKMQDRLPGEKSQSRIAASEDEWDTDPYGNQILDDIATRTGVYTGPPDIEYDPAAATGPDYDPLSSIRTPARPPVQGPPAPPRPENPLAQQPGAYERAVLARATQANPQLADLRSRSPGPITDPSLDRARSAAPATPPQQPTYDPLSSIRTPAPPQYDPLSSVRAPARPPAPQYDPLSSVRTPARPPVPQYDPLSSIRAPARPPQQPYDPLSSIRTPARPPQQPYDPLSSIRTPAPPSPAPPEYDQLSPNYRQRQITDPAMLDAMRRALNQPMPDPSVPEPATPEEPEIEMPPEPLPPTEPMPPAPLPPEPKKRPDLVEPPPEYLEPYVGPPEDLLQGVPPKGMPPELVKGLTQAEINAGWRVRQFTVGKAPGQRKGDKYNVMDESTRDWTMRGVGMLPVVGTPIGIGNRIVGGIKNAMIGSPYGYQGYPTAGAFDHSAAYEGGMGPGFLPENQVPGSMRRRRRPTRNERMADQLEAERPPNVDDYSVVFI